jgi:hypothetical protein
MKRTLWFLSVAIFYQDTGFQGFAVPEVNSPSTEEKTKG